MKSRVQKKETRWEKLDNTANLFPVIANETMTNVYRIAVILSENIEPECLQEALEQVLPWFNTMNVRMRTGMFWYYFETNVKGKPVVREEEDFPCRYIEQHRNKSYLFRVTYYKNRINLEVFHALADGMGAVNFLRELTYQYLRICYPQLSGEMGDRLCDDTSLDTEDRVVYAGSFSKILSPGMRLGYIVAPAPLAEKIEMLKQVNDVHTPMITQLMCVEFMKKYDIDKYIAKNRELYGKKCAAMVSAMEKYFPQGKVKWVVPEGGIFLWCECPTIEDNTPIVDKCLEKKVAIVPGSNFATDIYAPSNMFRLNYSSATIENIEEGVRRLGEVLTEML